MFLNYPIKEFIEKNYKSTLKIHYYCNDCKSRLLSEKFKTYKKKFNLSISNSQNNYNLRINQISKVELEYNDQIETQTFNTNSKIFFSQTKNNNNNTNYINNSPTNIYYKKITPSCLFKSKSREYIFEKKKLKLINLKKIKFVSKDMKDNNDSLTTLSFTKNIFYDKEKRKSYSTNKYNNNFKYSNSSLLNVNSESDTIDKKINSHLLMLSGFNQIQKMKIKFQTLILIII